MTLGAMAAAAVLVTACQSNETGQPAQSAPPPASAPSSVSPSPSADTRTPAPDTRTPPADTRSPGADTPVVVLDPGHNGGNAGHPGEINRQVPAGRGKTKPCNTTGTSTNSGFTEHAFTFDVARRVGAALSARGIRVVYTRNDDSGVGPCVDERAKIGNAAGAAAVVSIHADGSNASSATGFHVAYSSPPLNAAQGEPSTRLADVLRDGMRSAGFSVSNYIGSAGLSPRDDLAGLNLSERPTAMVECGNMRNAAEAAVMSSSDGRARYADAIATAITQYLAR